MTDAHRRVRAAAITGVGQLLGLLGSTLIGVLVAGTLPPSARVDAFFAANQLYALSLYLGQAVRITAPALLVRAGLEPRRLSIATGWLAAATVALLAVAAVAGQVVLASAARDAYMRDLLLLLPAAALHVAAGALAARMAVRGSFGWASSGYAAGSVVSGLLLLATVDQRGAGAIAPCLLAGALAMAVVIGLGFLVVTGADTDRSETGLVGVAPAVGLVSGAAELDRETSGTPARSTDPRPTSGFAAQRIALGAVPALTMQGLIAAVTFAAGHVVTGGTALLSYSFLALFAFTTISITPISIVLGPDLAERWDGSVAALQSTVARATRLSVVVVVPLIAVGFLIGRPLSERLLPALTPGDLDLVFQMLAVLCPTLLLTAAATTATVGTTAADGLGRLARVLALVLAALLPATVLMVAVDLPLLAMAAVASGFAITCSLATLWVAMGSAAWRSALLVVGENVPVTVPTLILVALFVPVARESLVWGGVGAVVTLAVHGGLVWATRRDTLELVVDALRARRRTVA